MSDYIRSWYYSLYRGRIAKYVARGEDRPERIIKAIHTSMARGNVDQTAIERMLGEIDSQTVQPFLGPPWNQAGRLERFNRVEKVLTRRVP